MQEILNHTQPYSFNWSKSVNDYTTQKRNLEWGTNPKQSYVSHRDVKHNEIVFNPILQVYNDKAKENAFRLSDRTNLLDTIAKNQDYQLTKEQTFNVINLRDRLKGFEHDPNYPQPKSHVSRSKDINKNKLNYNIVSNKSLSEHHYDKPENRPHTEVNAISKGFKTPTASASTTISYMRSRDYDIISNKYKEYNEEKLKVDREINKIQTAKLFYKKNDYNPVKGCYFDETKESNYQKKRQEQQKTWGQEYNKQKPSCAKGQSDLYNLINMKVVNENDLRIADEKEHNKKKRYELKGVIEDYYREKNVNEMIKKDAAVENKSSYTRYKEIDNRHYDIIDLKNIPYKKHSSVAKRDNLSDWEKIVGNAGSNNTFQSKGVYMDLYDYSDNALHYDTFTKKRESKLKGLPKIEADKEFNQKVSFTSKVNMNDIKGGEKIGMASIDKAKFFQPPKNIFSEMQKFKIISSDKDKNKKANKNIHTNIDTEIKGTKNEN